MGKSVGHRVVLARNVLNISGELSRLPLLPSRQRIRRLGHGDYQRLGIRETDECTAFQEVTEVTNGQELVVEHAVVLLRWA